MRSLTKGEVVVKFNRREILVGAAASGAVLATPSLVLGASYPQGPATVVCGYSAGGTTDRFSRLMAEFMSEKFGVPFVVENRTGAAGGLAVASVANSKPDGQTLLFAAGGQIAILPHTYENLNANPITDLSHVSMLAEGDFVLTCNPDVPAQNINEFIALAKEKPNEMFFGTSGAGGSLHLFIEYFLLEAGIDLKGVHYAGGSALMPDILNNQVQLALSSYPVAGPYVQDEKLRALMIIGSQRNENLPDVPVASEVGLDALSICNDWFALHGPSGMSDSLLDLLADTVAEAAETPKFQDALAASGLRTVADRPAEFRARIERDYELFGDVARKANVKIS